MVTRDTESVSGSGVSENEEDQATSTTSNETMALSSVNMLKAPKPSHL